MDDTNGKNSQNMFDKLHWFNHKLNFKNHSSAEYLWVDKSRLINTVSNDKNHCMVIKSHNKV